LIRINHLEAIVEPFWDPGQSDLAEYRVETMPGRELAVSQFWCWASAEWQRSSEPSIGRMTRVIDLDTAGYDRLVVAAAFPECVWMRVFIEDEAGTEAEIINARGNNEIDEYEGALEGYARIRRLTFAFDSDREDGGSLSLLWVGLAAAGAGQVEQYARVDTEALAAASSKLMMEVPGDLTPSRGLLFLPHELPALRQRVQREPGRTIYEHLRRQADEFLAADPSRLVKDEVFLTGRAPRFSRVRDARELDIRKACIVLSFVGLVENDAAMAAKACQCAFALASCGQWVESFMAGYPFSAWRHACFTEALCTEAVALVVDWAGACLNERGRALLVEAIYHKGLVHIEREFLKGDYYWRANPALVFMPPLMMGGMLLADHWPKYRPRLRQHYDMFRTVFDHAILPDGGTRLSLGYWAKKAVPPAVVGLLIRNYLAGSADPAQDRRELFPGSGALTRRFSWYRNCLEGALRPSAPTPTFLPVGDTTTSTVMPEGAMLLSRLARRADQSFWRHLAGQYLGDGLDEVLRSPVASIHALLSGARRPRGPRVNPLARTRNVLLPDSCYFTSVRDHRGQPCLFTLVGTPDGAEHRHREAGSLILEVGEEELLMERGCLPYSHPLCNYLAHAQYHNVLTPLDADGRPIDQPERIKGGAPVSLEDEREPGFDCAVELGNVWREELSECRRRVVSPDTGKYSVLDSVRGPRPVRVAFRLHTPFGCRCEGRELVITTPRHRLRIQPDDGYETLECFEDLVDMNQQPVNHLVLTTQARRDHDLTVTLLLEERESADTTS